VTLSLSGVPMLRTVLLCSYDVDVNRINLFGGEGRRRRSNYFACQRLQNSTLPRTQLKPCQIPLWMGILSKIQEDWGIIIGLRTSDNRYLQIHHVISSSRSQNMNEQIGLKWVRVGTQTEN
jgi:hypothetical protein